MAEAGILERADIFSDLTPEQLDKICIVCQEVVHFQGELIFAENSPSTEFYVILEGEVAIEIDPDLISNKETDRPAGTVAVLHPGQSFGEVALVDQGLRSASARCHSMTCKMVAVSREDLMDILKGDPEMGFIIMTNLARELCFKIRLSNFNLREALLYSPRGEV